MFEPQSQRTVTLLPAQTTDGWAVLETLPLPVVLIGPDSLIVRANRAAAGLVGGDDTPFLGMPASAFFVATGAEIDAETLLRQAACAEIPLTIHTRRQTGVSHQQILRWTIRRLSDVGVGAGQIVACAEDVTVRVRLEEQLEHQERIRSVGQAVAGVAHELGNPLGAILGASELLEPHVFTSAGRGYLQRLVDQTLRARELIRNLLSFVRGEDPVAVPVSASALVSEATRFLAFEFSDKGIHIQIRHEEDTPPVSVAPAEIQQVLINLLINAQQVLEGRPEPCVTVETGSRDGRVRIAVRDNGPGIPAHVLPHLFEPFFTTRAPGVGTGLGLSIAQGIVHRHGGELLARNHEDGGALFEVLLPAAGRRDKPAPDPTEAMMPGTHHDPARVLIVDDDEAVRQVISQALSNAGHEVDEASSAEVALTRAQSREYHLILCDLTLPGMNGRDFHRRLSTLRPELAARVVFASGGEPTADLDAFLQQVGASYLRKPFSVRRVLQLASAARSQASSGAAGDA